MAQKFKNSNRYCKGELVIKPSTNDKHWSSTEMVNRKTSHRTRIPIPDRNGQTQTNHKHESQKIHMKKRRI